MMKFCIKKSSFQKKHSYFQTFNTKMALLNKVKNSQNVLKLRSINNISSCSNKKVSLSNCIYKSKIDLSFLKTNRRGFSIKNFFSLISNNIFNSDNKNGVKAIYNVDKDNNVENIDDNIINHDDINDKSDELVSIYKEYQNLTWYFHPSDKYVSVDLLPEDSLNEQLFLNDPIIYKVIVLDETLTKGIDLVKCLLDSPFDSNNDSSFSSTYKKIDENKSIQEVQFTQKEVSNSKFSDYSPLSYINAINDGTSIINQTILKCKLNSSKLKNNDKHIEVWLTKGYDELTRIDRVRDYSIVVLSSFETALNLSYYLKQNSLALDYLKDSLMILADKCDENIQISIQTLFKHNFPHLNIEFCNINISKGNNAYSLLKESTSNAIAYQDNWLQSNLSLLKEKVFNRKDLSDMKVNTFNRRKEYLIDICEKNIQSRIQVSKDIIKECEAILNEMEKAKQELSNEIKQLNLLNTPEQSTSLVELIKQQKITLNVGNLIANFPLSYFKVIAKMKESNFNFNIESEVNKIQSYNNIKLQHFWDQKSKKLQDITNNRPTLTINYVNLNLFPNKLKDIIIVINNLISSIKVIDEVSKKQEEIITKSIIFQLLCVSFTQLSLSYPLHPSVTPTLLITSSIILSLLNVVYFVKEWNSYGNKLIVDFETLNNTINNELIQLQQNNLINHVDVPLNELINTQILPYHSELIAKMKVLQSKLKSSK
ncbi:hypothetical protein K502DRAFT_105689 [Neoconidiobolus thromboides FSU 785]|nr:hypothetical protein K502DRAFT_105689 [Neoconidiobolus thromboides FSU 785]